MRVIGVEWQREMARRPIRAKWLSNCSGPEIQQLNRLRLKGDSMMYEDVILAWSHRERIRIFLAEEEGHIIGWTSVLLPGSGNEFLIPAKSKNIPVYTYINRAYRGLGLGNRLLKMAYKFLRERKYKPTVFYWNTASSRFFKNFKKREAPKLVIRSNTEWWDIYG